jgi:hypothetical protein
MVQNETLYASAIALQESLLTRLIQRVYFFMIITAFLVGGLGGLLVSGSERPGIFVFENAICAGGVVFSITFTTINYVRARIQDILKEYIVDIEKSMEVPSTYNKLNEIEQHFSTLSAIFLDIKTQFFGNDSIAAKKMNLVKYTKASHTWLLPFTFTFFWVGAWAFVVVAQWPPFIFAAIAVWILLALFSIYLLTQQLF